jgi:hypothetical protein
MFRGYFFFGTLLASDVSSRDYETYDFISPDDLDPEVSYQPEEPTETICSDSSNISLTRELALNMGSAGNISDSEIGETESRESTPGLIADLTSASLNDLSTFLPVIYSQMKTE